MSIILYKDETIVLHIVFYDADAKVNVEIEIIRCLPLILMFINPLRLGVSNLSYGTQPLILSKKAFDMNEHGDYKAVLIAK